METREAASILRNLSLLMDLHGENSFKSKSIANAAFRLGKSGVRTEGLGVEELEKIEGIGKSIAAKIHEIQTTGGLAELAILMQKTPAGVAAMLSIKGLGPKKVRTIWEGLGIESMVELLYACNENRLVSLDGFGEKTQEQVKKMIEFTMGNIGKFHFAAAESAALQLITFFKENHLAELISLTGEIRRNCEVIEKIDILLASPDISGIKIPAGKFIIPEEITYEKEKIEFTTTGKIPVILHLCKTEDFYTRLFETTGSQKHLNSIGYSNSAKPFSSEEEIYASLGFPFIIPEMREGLGEIEFAKIHSAKEIIEMTDLKGILHNHSKYSDGLNTVSEMAEACKKSGYEYFGIADHSQTAVYANGLAPSRVIEQQKEIDELNKTLAPFRIFKGIESDILNDGSLDYEDAILSTFDYVVASVHSNLKMPEEKATARLLKAIENPFTTILGHPTGRLLLAREGYPVDHKKIIDACAANNVVIELNAHPYRLDLDWRWIQYAMEKNVMISINPDAHSINGLNDMYYGVCVARKAGLLKNKCFNALSREELENHFLGKKKR